MSITMTVSGSKESAKNVALSVAKYYRTLDEGDALQRGGFGPIGMISSLVSAGVSLYNGGKNLSQNQFTKKDVTVTIVNKTTKHIAIYSMGETHAGTCVSPLIPAGTSGDFSLGDSIGHDDNNSPRLYFTIGDEANKKSGILHFADQTTSKVSKQILLTKLLIDGAWKKDPNLDAGNKCLTTAFYDVKFNDQFPNLYVYAPPISNSQSATITVQFVEQ